MTRYQRPQTSYIHGPGPKRPGHVVRTSLPLVVVNEEPDFSRPPRRMDELDMFGSHARPMVTAADRKDVLVSNVNKFNVGRSVMRTGPERAVRVVDAGIVERLRPGWVDGRADSPTLPRGDVKLGGK